MIDDLAPGLHYFDELAVGMRWRTGTRRVEAADIDLFADLTGDRFVVHMDDGEAQKLGFPCRIAHGLLVLSLVDGLKNQAPAQLAAIASLGWDWTFSAPVLIDDVIEATVTIEALRATSDGARGIATLAFDVVNQDGRTVQKGVNRLLMRRRPAG